MNDRKKGKYIGLLATLVVHVAIVALLLLVSFVIPEKEEESGVAVVMGTAESAYGGFDPSSLVDVDITTQPPAEAAPLPAAEQELITQQGEETVAIEPKSSPKKESKTPEKTEAEKAAEARRLAEEQAERERKAAAEAANRRVAGAFGRGAQMENRGETAGTGVEGNPSGNASSGEADASSGYGTFDLGGRSLHGGLPHPVYDVQDEGRVVVSITVNPEGRVVATSINRLTNTVNPALRKAAEEAARKARFNAVEGLNNQAGTITYYFNLK